MPLSYHNSDAANPSFVGLQEQPSYISTNESVPYEISDDTEAGTYDHE